MHSYEVYKQVVQFFLKIIECNTCTFHTICNDTISFEDENMIALLYFGWHLYLCSGQVKVGFISLIACPNNKLVPLRHIIAESRIAKLR